MRRIAGMWQIVLATLLASVLSTPTGESHKRELLGQFESDWPIGDPRRCQEQMRQSKFDVKRFEAMPGIGWDNLRNVEGGMVVTYNYSQCKLTDDGRLLIPDNIFTVPIKFSTMDTFAELFDHWLNTTSTTSNTINIEAGLSLPKVSISGKFSYEHDELKSKQIEDKAVTTRVQLRYYRYEARLQPDPVLSPQFKSRLLSIAANIELNRTEQARYDGQLLVRDFGTHVLTSVTAGAGLLKDDYLKRSYVSTHSDDKSSILATSSATFFDIFKMSASYGHTNGRTRNETYERMLTHSFVKSHGGPMFQSGNMTIDDWINGVDDNLVSMDRSGDPLYFLVTPNLLPEVPVTTVSEVEKIVRQSIELYYGMNTFPGCTKIDSPNFSFSANFDDGTCHSKPTNLTFGGFFQKCVVSGSFISHDPCTGLNVVNPQTSTMSCPKSYRAVELQSGRRNGQTENKKTCERCYLFFHCCHHSQYYSEAVYSTYWCAATGPVEKDSGYLFGGLYTSTSDNLVTGTKSCPPNFYPRRMFTDLDVCIGDDYELGGSYSVPFGGFFSCKSGNPLAAEGVKPVGSNGGKAAAPNSLRVFMAANTDPSVWPSRCPDGYSQHLATDDLGCSIHYCVQTGALSAPNLPPIKRPPFMTKPAVRIEHEDDQVMFDLESQTWVKNEKAQQFQSTLKASALTLGSNVNVEKEMSPGVAAGISVGATLACVAIATLIFVVVRRRQARRQGPYRRLTDETVDHTINYGSTRPESTTINVAP
uniref:receptor protein-tyrosine kinase n=1 Tax=Arion vulgaris TaxID=1028688 RepID=A0A0B7B0Q7_9EUPU